jgi:hypothetical protein
MELVFDDGAKGVHDFSNLAGNGVFSIWDDPAKFADFHIGSCGELQEKMPTENVLHPASLINRKSSSMTSGCPSH